MLVSFSGLDGAGKTTLINELKRALEKQHYEVSVLTMYDDVSFYSRLRLLRDRLRGGPDTAREDASGGMQARERGCIGYRGDPRTDVSDKSGPLTRLFYGVARSLAVRKAILLLDLISLLVRRVCVEGFGGRVLIIDRYLYDSLVDVANLRDGRWLFIRLFMRLVPTPDAPVFVDVPAEQAFARKAEYPLEYMRWRRGAYRKVFTWVQRPIFLDNSDLAATVADLKTAVAERLGTWSHGI